MEGLVQKDFHKKRPQRWCCPCVPCLLPHCRKGKGATASAEEPNPRLATRQPDRNQRSPFCAPEKRNRHCVGARSAFPAAFPVREHFSQSVSASPRGRQKLGKHPTPKDNRGFRVQRPWATWSALERIHPSFHSFMHLNHLFIDSSIHSSHSSIPPCTYPLLPSFIYSSILVIHLSLRLLIGSFTRWAVRVTPSLFIHSFLHSFCHSLFDLVQSFSCSFHARVSLIHACHSSFPSSIPAFTHSYIHSIVHCILSLHCPPFTPTYLLTCTNTHLYTSPPTYLLTCTPPHL